MIAADKLEEAIRYRDRLHAILIFKSGLIDHAWGGDVDCKFGGYEATISMADPAVRKVFHGAVETEEAGLRQVLQEMGVALGAVP